MRSGGGTNWRRRGRMKVVVEEEAGGISLFPKRV
jgi:hypothetical protein